MNLGRKVTENQGKMKNMRFLLKFILSLQKSVVTLHRFNGEHGRLAQLVQSICLTSRGSGVRIPQRPLHKSSAKLPGTFFFVIGLRHLYNTFEINVTIKLNYHTAFIPFEPIQPIFAHRKHHPDTIGSLQIQ